jgi:hypothetical protein
VIAIPLVFAAKGPPPPTTVNVTTIVHDEDTAVPPNQLLLRSDDFNGVFQANYNDPNNYTSTVQLNQSGWQLYLGSQSLRRIWLTLSKPVGSSPPAPAPDGYYSANVEIHSACYDVNNQRLTMSYLAMTPGTSNNRCHLGVDFSNGRTGYKFDMGPDISGTGWATVSCNAANSTGACNNWTISLNMAAGFGNIPTIANLYRYGNHGLTYIGSYYNTYRIDVSNP